MRKRRALLVGVLGIMVAIAAIGQQKPSSQSLLILDWAAKAKEPAPPIAILIEMGLKDPQSKPWSGSAAVSGARVVHREGFRFRDQDKLVEPDGWQTASRAPIRGPKEMPKAVTVILDRIATVGVVLHLADVQPDAALTLTVKDQGIDGVKVPLKDLLAGKPVLLAGGGLSIRRVSTATPVLTDRTEDDFPAACYGPDGTLWVAYISYTVRNEDRRIEPPRLKEQPKDFKAYYQPEFGDQLFVKYYRDGQWHGPIAITEPKQDLMRCAIAAEGNGKVWVAYSANRAGRHDIYARSINADNKMSGEVNVTRPLTNAFQRFLAPVMATDSGGKVWLASQAWGTEVPWLGSVLLFGVEKDRWENHDLIGGTISEGPHWHPVIATNESERIAVGMDVTRSGDNDVHAMIYPDAGNDLGRHYPAATTSKFEARPAICYDPKGRLWIAYEEGPEQWGKDYGALDDQDGNPLYFARTVKVVCLENGKLMRPVAELPPMAPRTPSPDTGQKVEGIPRYAYPKIGIDGKGRVWVTYRQKFGTRYATHPGSYWITMARRLDGDRWSEPIEVHHSDGLLDDRPVLLPHAAGGLRIIHNTDGRLATPNQIDNQVYMSYVDLPGEPVEPKLVPHDPGKKDPRLVEKARQEAAAVQRIRDYRIDHAGKKLRLLRGEFHRHTEISWDGGPDGSLEDMFRYGIDAAAMDWIGNGDHDNGAGREYSWWLTQKLTDAYHVPDRFTPMFTYERSVSYPHGHRNCMFAQRGVLTLPRLAAGDTKPVAGIHADDAKMLYRYLKEFGGICASHTSATSMGTDWRDHDPVAEPIVEIYQGDRMSYEREGAPRAGYDPKGDRRPFNIAGWYPLGYVNKALEKGHRLGFIASSDHFSTHISYCVILAEKPERQAMLDAVKRRHAYGATDNIILDFRAGEHLMGDEFKAATQPRFDIRVIGTAPLAKVEILKDSEVVQSFDNIGKPEFRTTWVDPKPSAGVHYYYVRVQQTDDELAWSSPMWIESGR